MFFLLNEKRFMLINFAVVLLFHRLQLQPCPSGMPCEFYSLLENSYTLKVLVPSCGSPGVCQTPSYYAGLGTSVLSFCGASLLSSSSAMLMIALVMFFMIQ